MKDQECAEEHKKIGKLGSSFSFMPFIALWQTPGISLVGDTLSFFLSLFFVMVESINNNHYY